MNHIFKNQFWHFVLLGIVASILCYAFFSIDSLSFGELFTWSTSFWFVAAILAPILHQLYVLICWRLELHSNRISNYFGAQGFTYFRIGFRLLFASRLITILLLALANQDSLIINTTLSYLLSGMFGLLAFFLFYSVQKYFGMDRAMGMDHFEPKKYKDTPFVRKGMFKYSSNAMYVFGFLILYLPGLMFKSESALVVAVFNHLYIWVHYYFVEIPDMKVIYGNLY